MIMIIIIDEEDDEDADDIDQDCLSILVAILLVQIAFIFDNFQTISHLASKEDDC